MSGVRRAGGRSRPRTPRERVEQECARRGTDAVVAACLALLAGAPVAGLAPRPGGPAPVDAELVFALGGPPARWAVMGAVGGPDYWLRVWAARGLLYAWDPDHAAAATVVLIGALSDEAYRVREGAARVCGTRRIEQAVPALDRLRRDDERARVRDAAQLALIRIAGHAPPPI